jgi:hypothetical protein
VSDGFEVGQKVRYWGEEVEVSYGPFTSPGGFRWLVVRRGDGREDTVRQSDVTAIPELPAFSVGNTVTLATRRDGSRYTVEYGPFDDRDVYVVRRVDEPTDPDDVRTLTALASVMRKVEAPAVKVGDRVRVVEDDPDVRPGQFVGKVGTIKRLYPGEPLPYVVEFDKSQDAPYSSWCCAEVEPVTDENTYVYDGVTYDLSAKYRDRDGDVWYFARFGDKVVGLIGVKPRNEDDGNPFSFAAEYGPLTRVTD